MAGGRATGVARVLALQALAVAPTALVLAAGLRSPGVLAVAAACLGLGYLLLRRPGGHPVQEGAWLGMSIGGGLGLANAVAAQEIARACAGASCAGTGMLWLQSWLIAIVATAGIGLAAGFLANYELHHRHARSRRPAAFSTGANRFARLK